MPNFKITMNIQVNEHPDANQLANWKKAWEKIWSAHESGKGKNEVSK